MKSNTYKAHLPRGFETAKKVNERRVELVKILEKGGLDERRLAKELKKCRPGARCSSAACPNCVRSFRKEFLCEGEFVLESHRHWVRASIVPEGFRYEPGYLNQLDVEILSKAIRKRLERHLPHDPIVVGGFDVSFNTEENASAAWQLHVYMLIAGKLTDALRARLKNAFPPEPTAKRPYVFGVVWSYRRPLTYVYKSVFARRSGYSDHQGKHRVADQLLRNEQKAELAVWLDRSAIGSRLFLRGVKRSRGRPLRLKLSSGSVASGPRRSMNSGARRLE